MASDEEVLAAKSFDALEPHELARLYRLMSRLELATPVRRTRRCERGRHGRRIDMRRTLRGEPAHRRRPDPPRRQHRRIEPRRLVMLCDISGSMEPYARAYLQFLTCAARRGPQRRGVRLRHPADPADPGAALAPPRAGDPARRGGGAGLVERHPHRRCPEGVQRPPRAPRHGPRRGGGDPLRRLGARRSGAGGARDGAPVAARPPDRVGQPARERERVLGAGRRDGGGAAALRRAGERPQLRRAGRGRRGDRRGLAATAAPRAPEAPDEEEPWASATPVPGSSVAMPSGYGPSRGNTTPGWVTDDDG